MNESLSSTYYRPEFLDEAKQRWHPFGVGFKDRATTLIFGSRAAAATYIKKNYAQFVADQRISRSMLLRVSTINVDTWRKEKEADDSLTYVMIEGKEHE